MDSDVIAAQCALDYWSSTNVLRAFFQLLNIFVIQASSILCSTVNFSLYFMQNIQKLIIKFSFISGYFFAGYLMCF